MARASLLLRKSALAGCAALALAALAPAAQAGTSSPAARLVHLFNGERRDAGLRSLRTVSALSSVARRHAAEMMRAGEPFHSRDLPRRVRDWTILGEIVGVASSIEDLHDAFMGSARHRASILEDEFRDVGLGALRDEHGMYWVTAVLRG